MNAYCEQDTTQNSTDMISFPSLYLHIDYYQSHFTAVETEAQIVVQGHTANQLLWEKAEHRVGAEGLSGEKVTWRR